ncbi:type IIL restriction-modification enzyme MmeI, partial [Caulobacter sp. S45]|uniref:type IIL restriction-modification enzyme MmeI n=1 Tax=Caulobacter sp. S45 TaxID=1641861 RepID=UPI0035301456
RAVVEKHEPFELSLDGVFEAERWARATTGDLLGEEPEVGAPFGGALPAIPDRPAPRIAFVSTNSITQGEQVAQLWPRLFRRARLEIAFAHRTFAWGSDARGVAHVHVVIVGLARRGQEPTEKRLFSYEKVGGDPVESRHPWLSPYLFGVEPQLDPHMVVREESRPINGARRLKTGVQMIDNGILTFLDHERAAFLAEEPAAEPYFREYLGGDEYINGFTRHILYLANANMREVRTLPLIADRIRQVRAYRTSSDRPSTKLMADTPMRVGVDERLTSDYLVIPNTSSEKREYIPIGWMTPASIANQKLRILPDASLWEFGVLTSATHMAWMRAITGRLESRYMYSVGVVYNTFPWPAATPAERKKVEALAQAVLDARSAHPDATLADLYDPDLMPPDLRRAHRKLDEAVDRLYRRTPFTGDRDRAEHLFGLYERLTAGLLATPAKAKRQRRVGAAV